MKTQIVSLEPHDDLISVRDKLAWAKTPRILLVWPLRGRVDLRPLDLKLLQRHASGLGAQLGLVTRSVEMIQTAQALGLPVFDTASEAQRAAWPPRRKAAQPPQRPPKRDLRSRLKQVRSKEPEWLAQPTVRVSLFALGVLAVLAVAAVFVPRAEIQLAYATQPQVVDLAIAASPDFKTLDLAGNLPAQQASLTLEGSQTTRASGRVSVPQQKARGKARFSNLTNGEVAIPAGTVISTLDNPPVRFVTLQAGLVPAGSGKALDLPIEALEAGAGSNLPAGAIQAIQGAAGLSLAVNNPQATAGGLDQGLPGPNTSDHQRARGLLLEVLSKQAQKALAVETGGFLLANTLQAEVREEKLDPPAGQPGNDVTVSLSVDFTVQYVAKADMEQFGQTVMDASLPPGLAAVPQSLTWEALSKPASGQDGITRWQMRLERRLYEPALNAQVPGLVQGRPVKSAQERLDKSLRLAAPPQIALKPAWWPWMPLVSTRTQIIPSFP